MKGKTVLIKNVRKWDLMEEKENLFSEVVFLIVILLAAAGTIFYMLGCSAVPVQVPAPVVESPKSTISEIPKLDWESSSHPERAQWSADLNALVAQALPSLSMASDASFFCPNFKALTPAQQSQAIDEIIVWDSYYESSWNPKSYSVDVGEANDKNTWSVGLMQMSVVDQANYGFKFGFTYADLQTAKPNLQLAVAILSEQVSKYKKFALKSGEGSLYWSTLHPGGKYDKSAAIASKVKQLSFCN